PAAAGGRGQDRHRGPRAGRRRGGGDAVFGFAGGPVGAGRGRGRGRHGPGRGGHRHALRHHRGGSGPVRGRGVAAGRARLRGASPQLCRPPAPASRRQPPHADRLRPGGPAPLHAGAAAAALRAAGIGPAAAGRRGRVRPARRGGGAPGPRRAGVARGGGRAPALHGPGARAGGGAFFGGGRRGLPGGRPGGGREMAVMRRFREGASGARGPGGRHEPLRAGIKISLRQAAPQGREGGRWMGGRFGEALRGYVRRRAASHALAFLAFAAGVAVGAAAPAGMAAGGGAGAARPAGSGEGGGAPRWGEGRRLRERAGGGPPPPPEDVLRSALAEHVLNGPVLIGFFGRSVIGAPLVLAVVFARGFALGFAAALFVDGFFLRGVPLAVAALAPQALLAAPAVVAAGAAAVAFSAAAGR